MSKVTGLTELPEAPAYDDWLYLVDKSNTTDDAAGSSRKIQVYHAVNRVLLETITNATAGEFDFNNIPSVFNRLWILGKIRGDLAAEVDELHGYINTSLTDTDYHYQRHAVGNASHGLQEGDAPLLGYPAAANAPANSYSTVRICVENYADASQLKSMTSEIYTYRATDNSQVETISMISPVTAAVTRLRFRTNNHATDQYLGTLRLYGEM